MGFEPLAPPQSGFTPVGGSDSPNKGFTPVQDESLLDKAIDDFKRPFIRSGELLKDHFFSGIGQIREAAEEEGNVFIRAGKAALGGLQAGFSPVTASAAAFIKEPVSENLQSAGVPESAAELVGETAALGAEFFVPGAAINKARRAAQPFQVSDDLLRATKRINAERASKASEKTARIAKEVKATPDDLLKADVINPAGNINVSKIQGSDDIKRVISGVSEQYADDFAGATRGVVSHTETRKLADTLGMSVDDLVKRRAGQAFNAHEALAARQLLKESADDLFKKTQAAVRGGDDDLFAFEQALTRHAAIQEQVAGMTAEAGRALNAFKIEAQSTKASLKAIDDFIGVHGGHANIKDRAADLAAKLEAVESTGQANKFIREAYQAKTGDKVLEAWINSLLSGPQTHAVNTMSNTLVAIWTVPEHLIAAGIGKMHKGEKVFMREVPARMYGFVEGTKDGLRLAKNSILYDRPSDVFSKVETARHRAIGGKAGEVIRLPTRFLMAEDEFFKAIGYRMELRSRAVRQAAQEGLKGREFSKRVASILDAPPEDIALASIDAARYQTFTKPLGTTGRAVMQFANSHKGARLIMPFIRTPVNIVKFAGERTPFALFSKAVRDEMKKGGAARDLQIARMTMGAGVGAVVTSLAMEGKITGGGPTNYESRSALYDTGWQPYSIKIGDKYYAYNRLEPLGLLFGVSADLAEVGGELEEGNLNEAAGMLAGSVSKNLVSKTWLQGLSSTIEAIQDPDRYAGRFFQRLSGTLVPTGVAQIERTVDPTLRETMPEETEDPILRSLQSQINTWKARIPGYSDDLPPRRNVWGEPINLGGGWGPDLISPVYESQDKHDPTSIEVVRLDAAVSMPDKKLRGVQLSASQYDELVQLMGKPTKEMLDQLVVSESYKKAPDNVKKNVIEKVIRQGRELGRNRFMANHPEVFEKISQNKLEEMEQEFPLPAFLE